MGAPNALAKPQADPMDMKSLLSPSFLSADMYDTNLVVQPFRLQPR